MVCQFFPCCLSRSPHSSYVLFIVSSVLNMFHSFSLMVRMVGRVLCIFVPVVFHSSDTEHLPYWNQAAQPNPNTGPRKCSNQGALARQTGDNEWQVLHKRSPSHLKSRGALQMAIVVQPSSQKKNTIHVYPVIGETQRSHLGWKLSLLFGMHIRWKNTFLRSTCSGYF